MSQSQRVQRRISEDLSILLAEGDKIWSGMKCCTTTIVAFLVTSLVIVTYAGSYSNRIQRRLHLSKKLYSFQNIVEPTYEPEKKLSINFIALLFISLIGDS